MTAPRRGEAEGRARRALDRIVVARAEEQMGSVQMDERIHDRWQIGTIRQALATMHPSPFRRSRCLAGDCARRVTFGSYCRVHTDRLRLGVPLDVESYPTWTDYRRSCRGGARFGGSLRFEGAKP